MFVSTSLRVDPDAAQAGEALGELRRPRVVLRQAAAHLLERDERRGREDADLAHAAAEHLADAAAPLMKSRRARTSSDPTGAREPLGQADITESKPAASSAAVAPSAAAALQMRAPSRWTVSVPRRELGGGELRRARAASRRPPARLCVFSSARTACAAW